MSEDTTKVCPKPIFSKHGSVQDMVEIIFIDLKTLRIQLAILGSRKLFSTVLPLVKRLTLFPQKFMTEDTRDS